MRKHTAGIFAGLRTDFPIVNMSKHKALGGLLFLLVAAAPAWGQSRLLTPAQLDTARIYYDAR